MNKRAWAMTAPLVVLVVLLVASCGDDTPTGGSPAPPLSADVVPGLTLVGFGLTSSSEAPLAGVYVHGNYAFVGGMSSGYATGANIGVRIVDLSNPAHSVLVGRIPLRTRGTLGGHSHGDAVATHITSGAFQGDVAIVLYGVSDEFTPAAYPTPYGLWDVTDPSDPTFLSVLNLGGGSIHSDIMRGESWATSPMTRWQWLETTSMHSTTERIAEILETIAWLSQTSPTPETL